MERRGKGQGRGMETECQPRQVQSAPLVTGRGAGTAARRHECLQRRRAARPLKTVKMVNGLVRAFGHNKK